MIHTSLADVPKDRRFLIYKKKIPHLEPSQFGWFTAEWDGHWQAFAVGVDEVEQCGLVFPADVLAWAELPAELVAFDRETNAK